MSDERTSNLDIMQSDLPFGVVDCIYSDPPWGNGNLKFWRTHNGQAGHPVDWNQFLVRFFGICAKHCPNGPWFVETGTRFVDDCLAASPLPAANVVPCRYRAGSKWLPNVLLSFGSELSSPWIAEESRYGQNLIRWALSRIPSGSRVLDPCCGLGGTAKACAALGLEFYGNELNPKRLERTLAVLSKGGVSRK